MAIKFSMPTHMSGPMRNLLDAVHGSSAREKLAQYEKYRAKNKDGAVTYLMGERSYKRRLGLAGDAARPKERIHERLQAPSAWQARSAL